MASTLKEVQTSRGRFRIAYGESNSIKIQEKKWWGWSTSWCCHNDQYGLTATINRFNTLVKGL